MSIYVIGASPQGPLKIGISKNPKQRLATLQTASSVPLFLYLCGWAEDDSVSQGPAVDNLLAEKLLHAWLSRRRMSGEWFDISTEDMPSEMYLSLDDDFPVDHPGRQAAQTLFAKHARAVNRGGYSLHPNDAVIFIAMEPPEGMDWGAVWSDFANE